MIEMTFKVLEIRILRDQLSFTILELRSTSNMATIIIWSHTELSWPSKSESNISFSMACSHHVFVAVVRLVNYISHRNHWWLCTRHTHHATAAGLLYFLFWAPAVDPTSTTLSIHRWPSLNPEYIQIPTPFERSEIIHWIALQHHPTLTDTSTHGKDCDDQKVTGVTVKRKSMIYLDRE